MAIKKNPFGVGYSGERVTETSRECACCQVEYLWRGTGETWEWDNRCGPCKDHDPTTPEAELVMLREHQARLVEAVRQARDLARQAKRAELNAVDEVKQRRGQTASALSSRDRYREIVDAVRQEHPWAEPGHCGCDLRGCTVGGLITEVENHQRDRDRLV